MLLPGHQATRVRRQAAELLVRYLGGDLAWIDEVCAIQGVFCRAADRDTRYGPGVGQADGIAVVIAGGQSDALK